MSTDGDRLVFLAACARALLAPIVVGLGFTVVGNHLFFTRAEDDEHPRLERLPLEPSFGVPKKSHLAPGPGYRISRFISLFP